jgi:hypothetical protein
MPTTSEVSLESTFSDLAFARLRDKANALMDYLLGFQMLKADEDGSRAVGIFGFEIDQAIFYVPVFFLNGEIKGPDSIYSVESDLFCPIQEEWVNLIIHRAAPRLGESDSRSKQERGVRTPNYTRLNQIPGGLHKLSSTLMGMPDRQVPSLPEAVAGLGLTGQLHDLCVRYPKLAEAISKYYDLIEFAPKVAAQSDKPKERDLVLVTNTSDPGVDELTDKQREDVLVGGVAVIDKRPQTGLSIVYTTQTIQSFTTPTKGGMYDVVMCDGSIQKMIIGSDHNHEQEAFCYEVDGGRHGFLTRTRVNCRREYSDQEYREALDKVADPLDKVRVNDVVVLLSTTGESTGRMRIKNVIEGADGHTVLKVDQWYGGTCASSPAVGWGPEQRRKGEATAYPGAGWTYPAADWRIEEVLIAKTGGGNARYYKNRLVVGDKHFRAIKVDRYRTSDNHYPVIETEKEVLRNSDLGDHSTIMVQLEKIAAPVKIWRDSSELVIRDQFGTNSFGKVAALKYLLEQHKMGEQDAKVLVKSASTDPASYWVKYAAETLQMPDLYDQAQGAGFMSAHHPEQVPVNATQRATPENNYDFYRYNSPFAGADDEVSSVDAVDHAAQIGQKDVFDAAALSSLIKSHAPTELVDRYMPTIVAGMDKLGRLLFLVHWHYEEFEERYGENELAEFIDELRDTFNNLGSVVITLKKRTIAGDKDFFGLGLADTTASA